MNHRLVADEVAYILDHSDARAVFVSDAFLGTVERVRPGAGKVRSWILVGSERRPWAEHVDDLLKTGDPAPLPADPTQGLGGSMIYTGGTTGRPKGALRTATDPTVARRYMELFGLAEPHVHLVAGPLYHSAPGSFAQFTHAFGGTGVVMRKFDPEDAPGIELVLLDDAGRPVPTGTAGELYVRRFPGMFDGYYKDSAATREAQRGEWASVGDVAWMDDEGFVYICDRKRDMVISGGVNIYPAEIEDVLQRHPAIDDVTFFGVPDDD